MERQENLWQNIFLLLYEHVGKKDDNPMWKQFQSENLSKQDIKDSFKNKTFNTFQDAKDKFSELSSSAEDSKELVKEMKKESIFDNEIWKRLVFVIRDRKSQPLDNNNTISVEMGGQVKDMTNGDLERKLIEDLPDLMSSQICVPEHLVNDQFEPLNNEQLRQKLKFDYDSLVEKTVKEEVKKIQEYREMKDGDLKKIEKQAEKQKLAQIKQTNEASILQKRRADESEENVKLAIKKAGEHHGIPLLILQGVKSYHQVATHLKDLGIQPTIIGSKSIEVEHDVMVVAPLQTGLVVTFIQVNFHIL